MTGFEPWVELFQYKTVICIYKKKNKVISASSYLEVHNRQHQIKVNDSMNGNAY